MNKQELIEKLTEYVNRYEAVTDEYYQGRHGAYGVTLKLVKQLDEPQKPVVPQFVADLVDWTNKMQCAPSDIIQDFQKNGELANIPCNLESEKLSEYFEKAYCRYDFEKACFVGYEVEKEPLYYIKLFVPTNPVVGLYLGFNTEGKFDHSYGKPHITWGWKYTFTEAEIKAIDERYWAFAVPVDEVEEG